MKCRLVIVAIACSFSTISVAQKLKKADRIAVANLQTEIHYLADDRLDGRRTGTAGEQLASSYITAEFQRIGLMAKGENGGWLQPFDVDDGLVISDSTSFSVNNNILQVGKDFFPLPYSANGHVQGSPAIALQERGVPWFSDVKDLIETNQGNPHFDLGEALREKVKQYAKKGATAVIFFNSSNTDDGISFNSKDKSAVVQIPVLYITKETKKKYFRDEAASLDISLTVSMRTAHRTGHNVIGYIDNGAKNIVVIGAHYDHLGHGEDGTSLYRGTDAQIHNGADDNASGTAGLIELARMLKQSKIKNNNYLFIAFSGEELGLFGSKYFTEHPTVPLQAINYMLNMDMIGRLNDSTHALTLGGYGTSPQWATVVNETIGNWPFNVRYDSSGSGPSDYTSFYRKDIPVLFFFTGLHSDYHKPTDDADKINYTGEWQVVKFIYDIIGKLNSQGKIAFQKTKEMQMNTATRFTVTLGIMPDYSFSAGGVRIDGISEGRPAQKAGLQTGDIITKLGPHPVSSLEEYMQALSSFKKGDKTTVEYTRSGQPSTANVQF